MDSMFGFFNSAVQQTVGFVVDSGFKILTALVVFIIGYFVIKWIDTLVFLAISRQKLDETLTKYIRTVTKLVLQILLIVSCMGFLGVETTTFAAILGACGLAIGMAWSGLLSNFSAGAFLLFLRPFKVGDCVSINGITGIVVEIGVFSTTIDTPDKIRTLIGNNAIFTSTIQNFSTNPIRRVDVSVQAPTGTDLKSLSNTIKEKLAAIENVEQNPAPEVVVSELRSTGAILMVRPYCKNEFYWDVYNNTSLMLSETVPAMKPVDAVVSAITVK